MNRIVSRIRLAVSSSNEEADGGQHEHDPDGTELTKSRNHLETPAILHPFEQRMR
jgi:hypothetical protein